MSVRVTRAAPRVMLTAALAASVLACDALDPFSRVGPQIGSGRVEWAEQGVTVAFPEDWIVREAGPETADALEGMEWLRLDGVSALASTSPDREATCWLVADDPTARGESGSLLRWLVLNAGASGGWSGLERAVVDLPAGPAVRTRLRGDERVRTAYAYRGPSAIYSLVCTAAPAADLAEPWLPVARSIAFQRDATDSEAPAPVTRGGRIRRPSDGYALTLPEDWIVEDVDGATDAWLDDPLVPAEAAQRRTLLWAEDPSGAISFRVTDITPTAEDAGDWVSADDATAAFYRGIERHPNVVSSATEIVNLPAGRSGHNTSVHADGDVYDDFYLTDTSSWYRLRCAWSSDLPDVCRAVAESFEFLPREE